MAGSGTISVVKHDGTSEPFDTHKLAGTIWRAMRGRGDYLHALRLAEAVRTYVVSRHAPSVTSAAVFEMTIKAMKYVGLGAAAEAAENYAEWRGLLRQQLRIRHDGGHVTRWEKGWLFEFARRSWRISRATARILAGKVEEELLRSGREEMHREEIVEALNSVVAGFGLADAVPARLAR
jgi:hypothetical protein